MGKEKGIVICVPSRGARLFLQNPVSCSLAWSRAPDSETEPEAGSSETGRMDQARAEVHY